jgi:CDP-diacylglycerol--glycerol-3-phosphate 3-phosphatidyltransferase
MEKLYHQQIWNLPNGLTIIRILAIPIILFLLFRPEQTYRIITTFFFLSLAVTDTLDGYLARRRGMVTTLGKFLDPLADKLLIVTALIALIPTRGIPAWMVIVIVGREISVTGLRGIAASQGMVISASTFGKYKTVFEVASLACLILSGNFFSVEIHWVGMGLLWVAMGLAVISAVDYFKRFFHSVIV